MLLPAVSDAYLADMQDFSESGLFLKAGEAVSVEIGAIVEVQTTEFDDAPVQKARVVRLEPGKGFAVEFLFE